MACEVFSHKLFPSQESIHAVLNCFNVGNTVASNLLNLHMTTLVILVIG